MAEYYPLISRAVAGLREGAPEARRSIYDRARAALLGQLRGMQPAVPEEAITRELAALDEAIARIEGELAPGQTAAAAGPAAVEAALLGPRPGAGAATGSAETSPAPATPKAPQTSRPAAPLVARRTEPLPPRPGRPAFEPRASLPGVRAATSQPTAARPNAPVAAPGVQAPPAPPRADVAPERDKAASLPAVATLEPGRPPAEPAIDTITDVRGSAAPEIQAERAAPEPERRDEGVRPAVPPQPRDRRPGSLRVWIVAAAALVAVAVIALSAWKLRDTPEELAKATPPAAQPADSTPGKIVDRADGSAPADDASGTPDAAQPASPPADAGQQAVVAAQTPAATAASQPAGDQTIPVSYKAAILVAAPDTPERVKTYVGSVVWRSESASQGQDQPLGTAVRADIDVPDAKMQLTVEIRRNTEAQFPASHTIDLKFTVAPDSPVGAVKQVDVPQMRREDAATGDALVGVPVTITSNYFLVGLTRGDAEARNVEAIRSRGWFDIPMVLDSGKPAKITFEKGASGDRIIADALASWSRP